MDRDGTLNVDVGYPDSIEKIQLIPGAVEAIKIFNQLGFKIVVVTNQSGVARRLVTEEQVRLIHRGIQQRVAELGGKIDAFYYCPHHPDFGPPEYRKKCICRKPDSQLFFQAAREQQIDLQNSIMIGDKYSDVEAGKRLNMLSILVLSGAGKEQQALYQNDPELSQPDYVAETILQAAKIIQNKSIIHP